MQLVHNSWLNKAEVEMRKSVSGAMFKKDLFAVYVGGVNDSRILLN